MEYFKKSGLRSTIRSAKESMIVYRPDLGLVTRSGFYADSPNLKYLMRSELLSDKEMSHGLGPDVTIDQTFSRLLIDETLFKAERTKVVYESGHEIDYVMFSSQTGNVLVSRKKLKMIDSKVQLKYFTNTDLNRLYVKNLQGDIAAILMAYKAPEEDADRIAEISW